MFYCSFLSIKTTFLGKEEIHEFYSFMFCEIYAYFEDIHDFYSEHENYYKSDDIYIFLHNTCVFSFCLF